MPTFGIKLKDRRYILTEGETKADVLKRNALTDADVIYVMQLTSTKKPMSETAKAYFRAKNEAKKHGEKT
jgi:hypothetical protein